MCATIEESHTKFVSNSFSMAMSDDGYTELKSHTLTIYLPSYEGQAISRNEFDIYLAIGVSGDIKPYNSEVVKFSDTNIASVLSSIHVETPDINLLFHPSISAYIDMI